MCRNGFVTIDVRVSRCVHQNGSALELEYCKVKLYCQTPAKARNRRYNAHKGTGLGISVSMDTVLG